MALLSTSGGEVLKPSPHDLTSGHQKLASLLRHIGRALVRGSQLAQGAAAQRAANIGDDRGAQTLGCLRRRRQLRRRLAGAHLANALRFPLPSLPSPIDLSLPPIPPFA